MILTSHIQIFPSLQLNQAPMTAQVLHSPSHLPSSSPPSLCSDQDQLRLTKLANAPPPPPKDDDHLSLVALLVTVFRKSLVGCRTAGTGEDLCPGMEIGCPTDVRHVAHVTFDRFNGFLGLPVEFEPDVPRRAPSASASVFGVSTESMQLSYDARGNSVPTILLLMQRRLYSLGGLQAEGIFRINAENSQEEYVRDQLNRGVVPDGIDVHCLAGLIKAWLRELPSGVLDSLSPEQVMQCQSEEECTQLVVLLPPTEAALLDWAINLMADVVQEEHNNKMNARNIAMVFAPNMTQMDDPLTALMYAVQVMNFLKTLVVKMLREREDAVVGDVVPACYSEPSDENGHESSFELCRDDTSNEDSDRVFVKPDLNGHAFCRNEPDLNGQSDLAALSYSEDDVEDVLNLSEKVLPGSWTCVETQDDLVRNTGAMAANDSRQGDAQPTLRRSKSGQSSRSNLKKGPRKINGHHVVRVASSADKSKGVSLVSRINSRSERVEAWR